MPRIHFIRQTAAALMAFVPQLVMAEPPSAYWRDGTLDVDKVDAHVQEMPPVSWFSTGGETVYHLTSAHTSKEPSESILAASYSGKILCFNYAGSKLWEQNAGQFFPFDIAAGDLDKDGFDECVVASADGSLYIIDHDGQLLKTVFENKPPLYSVKIVEWGQDNRGILCGGPERVLYHISPQGIVLAKRNMSGSITNLDAGSFSKTGQTRLLVHINLDYNNVRYSTHRLPGLEMEDGLHATHERFYYQMIAVDTDGDGIDEIAFGGNEGGALYGPTGKKIRDLQAGRTRRGQHQYSMVMLDKIPRKNGEGTDLIGLNASNLRLYGAEGKIHKTIPLDISPAGLSYDRDTHTLLLGSGISGGDCIYIIRMNQSGWEEALEKLGYQGNLATIVSNIEQLIVQIKDFQPPPYQPLEHPDVLSVFPYGPYNPGTLSELETGRSFAPLMALHEQEFPYPHLNFAGNQWFSEDWDRSHLPYGWGEQRDRRMTYRFTSKEIVDHAKRLEAEGLSFVMTAGHGNDPFFMSLETFEGILRAAPTTCKGFIFPEVSRNDTPGFHYAVKKHFQAICELCLEHGKRKVFFRSKFLFWAGDCYTDMWSWMLEDKRYRDVLVPAMEETYERLGDLSLSGRVGLHQTGFVSDWAGRAVLDNPCYDREHHWSAPMVGSHFFRALCYRASLGARYFLIQVGGSTLRSGEADFRDHGLLVVKPFLHMLGKGILPLPNDREDLLSLSPVALGMRKPSQEFMRASHNSHRITKYESDPPWVFSRLQCFWGQAPTPAYDFGYYAIGRRSQALNFLPIHPYGLVSILPDDIELPQYPQYTKKISTDGERFYNSRGLRQSAKEYRPVVERSLQDAAESLPIMVEGDVAWSAVRIDPQHIRLVLIDKGYLDPAERSAIVRFQNIRVSECRDILSRERIDIADETMKLTVPAGLLRIVDVTHR